MKSAVQVVATTYGIVIAFAGLEHGIGETLQGSVPPPALVFESWPESAFLEILAGEPAMSVIPNLLITGLITVFLSLVLIAWSVVEMKTAYGGAGLILFSLLLLLAGGGFGPPVMLFVLGLAATRIHRPMGWWRRSSKFRRPPLLARHWRALLIASVASYLALLPGIPIAERLFGPLNDGTVVAVILFSFASFTLAILAALAADSYTWMGRPDPVAISL
jgi:hypothetical protein